MMHWSSSYSEDIIQSFNLHIYKEEVSMNKFHKVPDGAAIFP